MLCPSRCPEIRELLKARARCTERFNEARESLDRSAGAENVHREHESVAWERRGQEEVRDSVGRQALAAIFSCQRMHDLDKVCCMIEGLMYITTNLIGRKRGQTDVTIETDDGGMIKSM